MHTNTGAFLNLRVWLQSLTQLHVLLLIFYDTVSIIKGYVSALGLNSVVFTSRLVAYLYPRAALSSKSLQVSITVCDI